MTELFYTILNMSISASILVLVVLLLRLVFRRAPKWVSVLLWGLVAVRLICPFAPETQLSLMPEREWVTEDAPIEEENMWFDSVAPERLPVDTSADPAIGPDDTVHYYPLDPPAGIRRNVSLPFVMCCLWLSGVAGMLAYMLVSYLCVLRRVRSAKLFRDNIYISESVASPFVLGFFRPRIYLPENMDAVSMSYVIAHEEAHLRRRDHLWKPFGFLLLAVHWFNPLIWLSYILLCRDIEMACDERVVRGMNEVERADYSEALLECSVSRRLITACPLAFGETGVKERIRSVLNYKKPAFWIIVLAVIACAVAAVCFLTDPLNESALSIDEHDWYFERAYITYLENNTTITTIEVYQPGLQPTTENAEPVNTVLVPAGEPMWYDLITGDWGTMRFGNHFILEKADSKSAHYTVELYRDTGELYAGVTSKAVIEPMKDSDGYKLTIYEYSVGSEKEIIFTTKKQPGAMNGEKKLTIEDVLTLSQKQTALTWEDFAGYAYTDEGVGMFRCIYEIDGIFWLEITGGSMHGVPMQINLCAQAEQGDGVKHIDIRNGYDVVEKFINDNKKVLFPFGEPEPSKNKTPLTLTDVISLSAKGENLTWEDFAGYACRDVGSGLHVCRYDIDDTFYLLIGDGKLTGTPMYIRLYCSSADEYADVTTDDVRAFVDKYTYTPTLSYPFADLDVELENVADKDAFSAPIVCHYAGKTITVHTPHFTGIPTTSVYYQMNFQYKPGGYFRVKICMESGGKTFLVDRNGRIVNDDYTFVPNSTKEVKPSNIGAEYYAGDGIYIYAGDANANGATLYGLMDNAGKAITTAQYISKNIVFSLGYAMAQKEDGTWVGIDIKGNEYNILPATDSIRGTTDVVQEGEPGAYVQYLHDADGKRLSDGYDSISYFFGGLALIEKDNKMGLIAQDGTVVLPPTIAFDTVRWPTWGTAYRGFHHAFMDGNTFLVSIGGEIAVITVEIQ